MTTYYIASELGDRPTSIYARNINDLRKDLMGYRKVAFVYSDRYGSNLIGLFSKSSNGKPKQYVWVSKKTGIVKMVNKDGSLGKVRE